MILTAFVGMLQIANHLEDLQALERALDLFHAMLENPTLYIEPYVRCACVFGSGCPVY